MNDSRLSPSKLLKPATNIRRWAKPAVYTGLVVIMSVLPLLLGSAYILHVLIIIFIYLIATVSLRTITITGQFPMAHGAFMGIGAYVAGTTSRWLNWSPWITIPLAGLTAMVFGMLIGYPFSRLRTLYYAMGSLFFGIGVIQGIYAIGYWTGGYSGLTGIHPIFTGSKIPYYYLYLGLAVVIIIALYRFEFSRIGINLKAIAQSHIVASSVGINEGWYRIMVLGVGCFSAGLAGAIYAHYNLILSPTSFNFTATLWLLIYVVIGGIGSFAGPIIGTFILILIPEMFRDLKTFSPYLSAGMLLIVVYLMPQGLAGLPQIIKSWLIDHRKGDSGAHAS